MYKKYTDFVGCSSRAEFWSFWLVNMLIQIILGVIYDGESKIITVYLILVLLPTLSAIVRRLHDINESGEALLGLFAVQIVFGLTFYNNPRNALVILVSSFIVIGTNVWFMYCLAKPSVVDGNKYKKTKGKKGK